MAKDSRIAEIFRQELKKDKGLVSAYLSALGERGREKTDIRRILPQSGISGAISQRMFGRPYRASGPKGDGSSGIESKSMLTKISMDGQITAKNSLFLPQMAKDMNLMRQNIAKLVKSTGVTPATKASSAFFGARKAQEDSYESKFKKDSSSKLTPTKVEGEDKPGIGSMLLGLVGEFFSGGLVSIMLKTLTLVGIGAFVKAMFTDSEFAKSIKEGFQLILQGTGLAEVWEKVKTGALVVVGAIAGLYIAFNALTGVIFGLAARWAMAGGIQGPAGSIGGPAGGKLGKIGKLGLGLGAGGLLMKYLSNTSDTSTGTGTPGTGTLGSTPAGASNPTSKPTMSTSDKIGMGLGAAGAGISIIQGASPFLSKAAGAIGSKLPSIAGSADVARLEAKALMGSKWDKFVFWLSKKSPELFAKVGVRLASAATLATIPILGWVAAAIQLGFGLWTAWELYGWWKQYSGEKEEESTAPTPVNAQTTPVSNSTSPVSTPTTSGATTTPTQSTSPTQTSRSAASTSPTPSSDSRSDGSMQSGFGANSIQDIVPGGVFTSGFKPRWGKFHKGWDIGAPTGSPVKVPVAGTVSFAGATSGYGNHIEVDHGDGKKTTYSHLSKINVAQGQAVTPGQVIGAVGNTGDSTGPHLHFGIKEGSNNIDPVTFFAQKPRNLDTNPNTPGQAVASSGTPSLLPGGLLSDNSSIPGNSGDVLGGVFELLGQMIQNFGQSVPGNNAGGQQQAQQQPPQQVPNNSTTDPYSKEAFELFFAQSTGTGNIRV